MSVRELLARKRTAQIDRMQGGDPDETDLDEALASVRLPAVGRARVEKGRLKFSRHAHHRMSQRGMKAADVYLIWRVGEPVASHEGTAFWVTDRCVQDASARDRDGARRWRGAAIIVQAPAEGYTVSMLITVLADGEDTHFKTNR